jgi:CarboxypepD_reg-like domain
MSSDHKNIPRFSTSDIQKYWRGELSTVEKHALESAALDDPFLADAIEGMEGQTAEATDFDKDSLDLQGRLHQLVADKRKRSPIRLWTRWAAAAILFIGMGSVAYYSFLKKADKTVAVTPTEPVTANVPAAKAPTANAPITGNAPASSLKKRRIDREKLITHTPAPNTSDAHAPVARSLVAPATPSLADTLKLPLPDHLALSGKVLDEHDHPLAGASISFHGHPNVSTVTNDQGFFNLSVPPTDSTIRVMVAHTGYEQTTISLNAPDQQNVMGNIIRLQPQHSSLAEVVVTGYGQKRKETYKMAGDHSEKIDTLWILAAPVDGREDYFHYLQATCKQMSLDPTIKGAEIISFNVNKKGHLSSFRVEQSLSPAHDSATIRMIQQGPAWKLAKGNEARTAVRVLF